MTLDELWELFPVFLVPYDEKWKEYYNEIETEIKAVLSGVKVYRISHIGSTAVKKIQAKNIVDVLVEMDSDIEEAAKLLEKSGSITMSSGEKRISLNKGYTKDGFAKKVYHIHLRCRGDNDELYFRDYLNEHAETAKEYEALKKSLAEKFRRDRDGYTEAKTEFISRMTARAPRAEARNGNKK